jgi:protein involved in polysaccharide export with SLBB domain
VRQRTIASWLLVIPLTLSLSLVGLPAAGQGQPRFEETAKEGTSAPTGIDIPVESPEGEVIDAGREAQPPGAVDQPLEAPLDPGSYMCGSGDVFELRCWGTQNLSIRLMADPEGNAFIPKVGKVRVAGKNLTSARADVLAAVRRYYPGLKADLALLRPRRFVVHLVGDVKRPGLYDASPLMRVSAMISQGGGATGSVRRVQIRRRGGQLATADLLLYERTGELRYNPYLLDGDVVQVPTPAVEVGISGPVRYPGRYELVGTRDMAELLELAGGLRSAAARTLPIQVMRRNRSERKTRIRLPLSPAGGAPSFALRDDDEVLVPSTGELERSIALVGAVVGADPADPATTVKRITYVEGDTVRSLIERAGGVTVSADLENSYIQRDGEKLRPLDLEGLLVHRDFSKDRAIRVGDTIVVPFRRASVLIEGAVVRAGTIQFNPRFGVREYLASAGGTTRYAQDEDEIRLFGADGKVRPFSPDLRVRPGDTIVVPERNFSRAEVVQLVMGGVGIALSAAALTYAATR